MFKTALSKIVKGIKGRGLYILYIKTVTLKLLLVKSYTHLTYINRFMYAGLDTELTCFPGRVH